MAEGLPLDHGRCACCQRVVHINDLDAKPARLAGPIINADEWYTELQNALWANEDCDRLECEECYGPGYTPISLLGPAPSYADAAAMLRAAGG
jgi:hypothetical protein